MVGLVKDALTKRLEPACALQRRLAEVQTQCDFLSRRDCSLAIAVGRTVLEEGGDQREGGDCWEVFHSLGRW